MVGRAGFEPAYRFREPNLQSGAINHSTTDPQQPFRTANHGTIPWAPGPRNHGKSRASSQGGVELHEGPLALPARALVDLLRAFVVDGGLEKHPACARFARIRDRRVDQRARDAASARRRLDE